MNKKKMSHKQRAQSVFAPIWTILIVILTSFMVTIDTERFWISAGICIMLYLGILMLV